MAMDVEFKKRLTGAVLLVLLAVLIIPELLSGPPKATSAAPGAAPLAATAAMASGAAAQSGAPANQVPSALRATVPMAAGVTVDPASAAPTLSYTIKLDNNQPKQPTGESRQRDSVAVTPPPPPLTTPVPGLASRSATAAAPPATPGKAASAPLAGTATSGFSVQLGSFALRASADRLVRELRANGFAAYVSTSASGGKTLHRVRVGAVTDRASAATLLAQLRTAGMKGIANSAAIVAATSGSAVSSTISK